MMLLLNCLYMPIIWESSDSTFRNERLDPVKILFVNKFLYPRGGAETYFLRIGEELTRRGHEVEYFGMYDEKNTVGNALHLATTNMDFHNAGPEKLLYPFRILYSFEAKRKLKQVIGQFQPDLIHFNNINFQLTPSVICAGAECGVPMVQTVHDVQMLCPNHMMMEFNSKKLCEACMGKKSKWPCVKKRCIHGSLPKSLIGAVEGTLYECNHVYDKIDRFICPSAFLEKKLLTVPRFRGKTVMLHNFLSRVAAAAPAEKGDYVLYFGRLSEEKGIDRILEACKLLPDIPFVIAGSGPMEDLCKNCTLPNVKYVGFQTGKALEDLVAGALFTLHLSIWYENCPLALLESQSLGTPVLCNRIGGIPGTGGRGPHRHPERHLHPGRLRGKDPGALCRQVPAGRDVGPLHPEERPHDDAGALLRPAAGPVWRCGEERLMNRNFLCIIN